MSNASISSEPITFFGTGLRAELGSSGERCWFQVELSPAQFPEANAICLEVLYQPRNDHGLPYGSACVIFEDTWLLNTASPRLAHTIFGWLPRGINPENSRQCHYRVTPVKINPNQNSSQS